MGISVNVVQDNTGATKDAKDLAVTRGLEMIGLQAETYAKLLCAVDTGNLRNSITHEVSGDEVYVGTNVEYGQYVEFGHTQEVGRYVPKLGKRLVKSYVPPKPFLAPAVENHMDEYKKMIEYSLRQ